MAELNDWAVAAANNNSAPPDGAPEGSTFLPDVNDILRENMAVLARANKDTDGSLTAGGTANALTLTTNGTYTTPYDGQRFVFRAASANTGAVSITVSSISSRSIITPDGLALLGGEWTTGDLIEITYDATSGFWWLTSVNRKLIVASTNAPSLADADTALVVGDRAGTHLAAGPADIQAKATATTAAALNINQYGGDVAIGAQSGTGETSIYDDGVRQIRTQVHNGAAAISGAQLRKHDGVFYDIATALLPNEALGTVTTLSEEHCNAVITSTDPVQLTMPNSSNIPVGAWGVVMPVGAQIDLLEDTGITVRRFNGNTTSTGTLNLAVGSWSWWWKASSTEYYVFSNDP